MDETEYIATREQREPILREILAGYVPRRIDGQRDMGKYVNKLLADRLTKIKLGILKFLALL